MGTEVRLLELGETVLFHVQGPTRNAVVPVLRLVELRVMPGEVSCACASVRSDGLFRSMVAESGVTLPPSRMKSWLGQKRPTHDRAVGTVRSDRSFSPPPRRSSLPGRSDRPNRRMKGGGGAQQQRRRRRNSAAAVEEERQQWRWRSAAEEERRRTA